MKNSNFLHSPTPPGFTSKASKYRIVGAERIGCSNSSVSGHASQPNKELVDNRLPAASRKRQDNSTIHLEIGARSQAACDSTLTLAKNRGFRAREREFW